MTRCLALLVAILIGMTTPLYAESPAPSVLTNHIRLVRDEIGRLTPIFIKVAKPLTLFSPAPTDGPLTNLMNLRGRTDENGYLRISAGTAGVTDGPLTAIGNLLGRTDENGYLRVSCSGCSSSTLTAPVTITGADNTQSLLFPTVTYTSDMTTKPLISIVATENTGAGTHDLLKMAITRTAGEFNFLHFLGGPAGATEILSVDRSGSLTANGNISTIAGAGGVFSGGDGASAYYTATSFVANTRVFSTTGTRASSNTGSNAVSAWDLAHTLNTSGVPSVFKLAVTDTAHGAGTKLFQLLGGATAVVNMFSVDTSGQIIQAGLPTVAFVTANFSTAANTNLQTITGLTFALPALTALNVPFTCKLAWSQATAAVVVSFGVQSDTVNPTNFMATGQMETNLTVTSYGNITALATTTATAVVTGTPAATATVYNAYLDGFLENPSNASVTNLNIMVKTATAGDVVTVYRGSFCRVF